MTFDIRAHGRRFLPEYPPHGFSDHLPMAWLAMEGLGAPAPRREAFAAGYLPRLAPLAPRHPLRRRQEALIREMAADGLDAVVAHHLPALVSGWYREAYHPLIRLAYAVQFGIAEEAAAALAYMEAAGPDTTLAGLAAASAPAAGSGGDLFHRAATRRADAERRAEPDRGRSFTSRARDVLAAPWMAELALVVDDNLRQMSMAALAAFDATHDFFALHLVTASHGFRLLHGHAGPHADAVFNLGLLAGYLAIGAPPIAALPETPATPSAGRLLELCRDDEHDLKVAFSALEQGRHWNDGRYPGVVERYLHSQRTA